MDLRLFLAVFRESCGGAILVGGETMLFRRRFFNYRLKLWRFRRQELFVFIGSP
jgi:hypothetical protein